MASAIDGTSGSSSTSSSSSSTTSKPNAFSNLDVSSFITLMITEMQNQDPLNPMDNNQMMQQLGQLQSMNATQKLTTTLNNVLQGQSFSTASSLLGKKIDALDDQQNPVSGVVDKVSVADGDVKVEVNGAQISLDNISDILPTASN